MVFQFLNNFKTFFELHHPKFELSLPDSLHSLRLIINQIKYHAILVRILFKLDPRFDFLRKKRNSLNQKTMTDSQNLLLKNGCFTIIFSPSTKKIFFKTEFLTVIFRGLTNVNLYWFKSYDTNAKKNHK